MAAEVVPLNQFFEVVRKAYRIELDSAGHEVQATRMHISVDYSAGVHVVHGASKSAEN